MNMSYCRFTNTRDEFTDCAGALEEVEAGNEVLSADELRAAIRLVSDANDLIALIRDHLCKDEGDEMKDEEIKALLTMWNEAAEKHITEEDDDNATYEDIGEAKA